MENSRDQSDKRNYVDSKRHDVVTKHYRDMRTGQTVEYVNRMMKKYSFDYQIFRKEMSIREAFKILENYVDSSDPDMSLPNMIHMLQTAEGIKKDGHEDWFQLVGLIHDMGKIMYALGGTDDDGQMGTANASQWGLGGDTWIVGCKIPDCVVYPEFNTLNIDSLNSQYNTEYGIYHKNCGLKHVQFAYGHDEYLYQMLIANNCTIPKEGLAMVRYHSLYPWHTGGAYRHLMDEDDYEVLPWVLKFNQYDLYTKDETRHITPDRVEELWTYYQTLIDKYFPTEKLRW